MTTTLVRVAIVIAVQAIATAMMYGLAAEERLAAARSPVTTIYLPTLAAFAVNGVILWHSDFLLSKPVVRIAVVISGAALASGVGLVAALIYGVNRWGA